MLWSPCSPTSYFNVLHLTGGAKIDVFVPEPNDRLAEALLERRARSEMFGVPCWIASAEDVLLAKLRRRLTTRSERQRMDCGEIVASVPLDREYLWTNADAYGVANDLRDLLPRSGVAKELGSRNDERPSEEGL